MLNHPVQTLSHGLPSVLTDSSLLGSEKADDGQKDIEQDGPFGVKPGDVHQRSIHRQQQPNPPGHNEEKQFHVPFEPGSHGGIVEKLMKQGGEEVHNTKVSGSHLICLVDNPFGGHRNQCQSSQEEKVGNDDKMICLPHGKETADKAQSENAKAVKKVIAQLTENGVAEKSIRTTYYSMYPEYDYSGDGEQQRCPSRPFPQSFRERM